MKGNDMLMTKQKSFIAVAIFAAVTLLVACGGGGGSASNPTPPAVTGSQSGVLTDAAVQGVSYRTSSGVTGVTDATGKYNFNPGDTVVFTLGGLTLGNVTATGIISPIQLAANDSNKLNNLLVLLQSLDTDGNPSNGITIAPASAAAVPSSVNLSQATNTFASSANTGLVSAMNAGGITRSVTSLASATAHFKEQGLALLSANVLVMYSTQTAVLVRIMPNGSYIQGQADQDDNCGANGQCGNTIISTAGVERGTVSVTGFSTTGYQISAAIVPGSDTNIQAGLSHPAPCDINEGFLPNGEGFLTNVGGSCTAEPRGQLIGKAPNVNTSLVGVWALGTSTSVLAKHFVFLPNGKYLMVDPIGDTGNPSCGGPGVEFGSYTWNSTTGQVAISNVTYDTNACAGLFDLRGGIRKVDVNGNPVATGTVFPAFNGTITLNAGGQTAAVIDAENPAPGLTLYRVSK
jgi:hypothetical protein